MIKHFLICATLFLQTHYVHANTAPVWGFDQEQQRLKQLNLTTPGIDSAPSVTLNWIPDFGSAKQTRAYFSDSATIKDLRNYILQDPRVPDDISELSLVHSAVHGISDKKDSMTIQDFITENKLYNPNNIDIHIETPASQARAEERNKTLHAIAQRKSTLLLILDDTNKFITNEAEKQRNSEKADESVFNERLAEKLKEAIIALNKQRSEILPKPSAP